MRQARSASVLQERKLTRDRHLPALSAPLLSPTGVPMHPPAHAHHGTRLAACRALRLVGGVVWLVWGDVDDVRLSRLHRELELQVAIGQCSGETV